MSRIRAAGRLLRALAVAFALLWTIVTLTPVTRWIGMSLMGPWNEARGDVLVVLGADGPTEGLIGAASYWRAFYAALAWRQGGFRTVIVSGGSGTADSIADYLRASGVPADRLVLERRSTSTRENALFTIPLLRAAGGRAVLLTTDYHVYRSLRVFRRAGAAELMAVPVPYAIKRSNSPADRWPLFLELLQEIAKIAVYRARGWM